ncbi:hypothetical protein FI667_g811, partial [Globisporangium splendens]
MDDGISTMASPLAPAVDAGVRAQQQAAFRAARRKFALYGRQHAHVSHLAGQSGRSDNKGSDAGVLTNTLLLQENGALALHADDLQCRLDGILQQTRTSSSTSDEEEERIVVARARSVVELARMLQREDVQRMLKLSRQSARLCVTRIHDVTKLLRRRRTDGGGVDAGKERSADELLRLSVAVLLFSLTLAGSECDEWFPRDVLDLMAECLQHEFDAQVLKKKEKRSVELARDEDTKPMSDDTTQNAMPSPPEERSPLHRRKMYLKHKKQSIQRRRSMSTSGDDDDTADQDPQCQLQRGIAALLNSHDGFDRIKKTQVTITDVLVITFHNLLQMDSGHEQQQHNAHLRRKDEGLAGATFATIRARQRQLLDSNALNVLVDVLAHEVQQLQWPHDVEGPASFSFVESSVSSLKRVETILRVLDQASFLETEVQRQLSTSPGIFTILLKLVEQLSKLCWGQPRQQHDNEACDEDKTLFSQDDAAVAEVLLVSMRVLINLTHHNEDAARHIYGLHGMKTLFRSFCKLWEVNESTTRSSDSKATADYEDKLLFDAFLMFLSALTNCVELSPENRNAVTTIAVPRDEAMALGVDDFEMPSVCGLFTKFFLSKVQSYRRLLEWNDTNPDSSVFAPMENDENVQWVPEDVILGGCSSLLLGCLVKDSPSNAMQVLDVLPDRSPRLLLRALSAFVALHSQIGALTPEVGKSVLQVEQTFKSLLAQDGAKGSSTALPDSNVTPAFNLAISAKITMIDTERAGGDAASLSESTCASGSKQNDDNGEKSLCAALKRVRTPPASAFKLHSWKKVCSTVDSDDESEDLENKAEEGQEVASVTKDSPPSVQRRQKDKISINRKNGAGTSRTTTPTASPLKKASPYRGAAKGNLKRKQASPAQLKRVSPLKPSAVRGIVKEHFSSRSTQASPLKLEDASSVKFSPSISGSSASQLLDPSDGSTQRLKRARRLITGLEAALSKVDGGSSTTMPSARLSACMTSTESLSQNDDEGDNDGRSCTPDFFHDDVADRVILLSVRNSPFRSKAKSARLSVKASPSPTRKTGTLLRKVQTDQLQDLALLQDRRQATTVASLSLSLDAASSSKAALTAATEEAIEDTSHQTAVSSFPSTKRRKQKTAKPLKKDVAAGIFDFDA